MLTISDPKNYDWKNIPLSECLEGNAYDAYFTLKLYHQLKGELEEIGAIQLYEGIVTRALVRFAIAEFKGINVLEDQIDTLEESLGFAVEEKEDDIYISKYVDKMDNLKSTKQQVEIYYTRDGGMELYPPKFSDKGQPSTDKKCLQELLDYIDEELQKR